MSSLKTETSKPCKRSALALKYMRHVSLLKGSMLSKQVLVLEASLSRGKLASHRSKPTVVTYPISGENIIDRVFYVECRQNTNQGLIWINQSQYFENVPPDVWNFCLGNYYVCQKWLKMREGSTLKRHDIQDYQRLVMLVSETIDLMNNLNSTLVNS